MFRKATIAALALAVSGIAVTAQANDQLAATLGVAPGQYSAAELTALKNARDAGDQDRAAFILSGSAPVAGVNTDEQLAASVGVAPGQYSAAELVALRGAQEDRDALRADYIRSGTAQVTRDAVTSPAEADSQLAQLLNVDGSQYTNAELAAAILDAQSH
ncbi:hypothetical protein [Mangrovicoccus algicola]|uniref:Uncharacterized protein n=1 Tax=Mangrovicoccus algicola TaxID=2771008 RepID=A0A8J7CG97_9RHOB|nr:hypothetical protein [Mangrovicoccus algicola]MBE3636900.1 hypothetical protein [Mangrovicoccus algicola]